ncbi:response regulator [Sideroxydans lithotrophicus]|uniref:Response regulator receiver protein n=1 Tax=Sideroxydans lithotrophicus (strain ES-1) TaxID=580332 RepID=D5CSW2_SIDLE|nr:response regulator transcription factor [Sideroxydans lithotrophicus]ADE12048.1 response regulator receiver protein [Sideroxydans lithotrophicus ES-1]
MNKTSALIVDDNADFRHSLNHILSSGFPSLSIAEADAGKAALEQIQDCVPDLVFMDVNLPDANGLILTKAIKVSHADTTVIVITAYDLPEYRQAAFDAGASHFIPKGSMSEEEILQMVKSVMAGFSSSM